MSSLTPVRTIGTFTMDEMHNLIDLLFFCECEKCSNSYAIVFWELRYFNKNE